MSRIRIRVLVSTIAAACLAVGGLVSSTPLEQAFVMATQVSEPQTEPQLGQIHLVTDWRQITLPLDEYGLSLRENADISRAEQQLTKTCMQRFGFDFETPPWDRWVAQVPDSDLDAKPTHYRLFGLLDETHAAQTGYHVAETQPAAEAENGKQEFSDDYANVLGAKFGGGTYRGQQIHDGGCIGLARQNLAAGSGIFDSTLPERLSFASWDRSNEDSRVAKASVAWSSCMNDAGFNYRTPADANNDTDWSGEKVTKTEIAVALADVKCKKQTNLVGIRMAVDSAYQLVAIQAHAQELSAVKEGQQRQVDNADALLTVDQK